MKKKKCVGSQNKDLSVGQLTTTKDKSDTENLWTTNDIIGFVEKKLDIKLDDWQKTYILTKGNTAVRAGRQSGKSFAESLRTALYSLLNPNTTILIIAAVERQAELLYEKVKSHIIALAKHMIVGRPTAHEMNLKEGRKILALPAGRDAYGLRGYTVDKLVADEAHYIGEEVWTAIRPMLATTGGTMDLLSTPKGNKGFFYEASHSDDFTTLHIKSEDCPRISAEFLKAERRRMTKLQYMQEYEAEFLDHLQQFFPVGLIESCMIIDPPTQPKKNSYMGVDIARYGGDENAYVIVDMNNKEQVYQRYQDTTERISTMSTSRKIIELTKEHKLRKVYIDDGGIGGAVFDYLIETPELGGKIVGINNASRSLTRDKKRGKKLLKEDLYGNLRRMMEQGHIKLIKDPKLRMSLLSIQFEYTDDGNVKIFGRYTHLAEALIRACWCVKSAALNLWAASNSDGKENVFKEN